MAIKISELSAAPAAQLTDQFETNQGGASFRETNQQKVDLFNGVIQLEGTDQVTGLDTALTGKADLVLSNLSNTTTARSNLGLGSIAVLNTINNGNWSGTDLTVPNGGTGVGTIASGGLMVGNGVSPVSVITGGVGTVLTGTSGNPAFASTIDQSTVGVFQFTNTNSPNDTIVEIINPTTNNTSADAHLTLQVGGTGGGDPFIITRVPGGSAWSFGIDNSDSDSFKLATATGVDSNVSLIAATGGAVTLPRQPAFLAIKSATTTNVTGNGENYTVSANTEIYDQGSNYNNANFTFTAPVTGRYKLGGIATYTGLGVTNLYGDGRIVASNRTAILWNENVGAVREQNLNTLTRCGSVEIDMDANDTAIFTMMADAGTTIVGAGGHATNMVSAFFGHLIC